MLPGDARNNAMKNIDVSVAVEADIPAIFAIRTCVKENHLSLEELTAMGITPDAVSAMLAAAPCIWIARVDGVAAGFAMADLAEGSVFAAFVRPEMEGMGLGRQLMQAAEDFLFPHFETLWLETDSRSRAAGFYQKLGWIPVASLDNHDIRLEKNVMR